MRKPLIKPEIIEKVWKLHNKHIEASLIAETLGISVTSARRIISIMTTAQNGGDVDAVCVGYQKQKHFAKSFFGIAIKAKEEVKSEEQKALECVSAVDGISKEFMQRVVLLLSYQNRLLEQLCAEFGVNVKIFNEVERR